MLLTSEQIALFVGYESSQVARSLEAFIEAGLLERTQNPMHAARLYLLVPEGPQNNNGIRELVEFASDRNRRRAILGALRRSESASSRPQAKYLLKIA